MERSHSPEPAYQAIELLQRLTALVSERRRDLARSVGLTEQQWRVLEEISAQHFIPSLFARRHESSAAAVSKITRQLTDKGLVCVSISPTDARQRNFELTVAGTRAIAALRRRRERAVDAIWRTLSSEQLSQFIDVSATLVSRIEAYREPATEKA